MKAINLNRFKNQQAVELDGVQYSVKGISVDMYLNDSDLASLDVLGAESMSERMELIIAILCKISTVPREILVDQPVSVLLALMQVAQGSDPTIGMDDDAATEGKVPEAASPNALTA